MFGARTADLLGRLTVGIVGVSGTGSPIIEMLVRLGVGRLVLVDDDTVEVKNLNRIYGTRRRDADQGTFKALALADHIRDLGLDCASPIGRRSDPPWPRGHFRIRKGFAACVADAGLPESVTPHWLRHTAATLLIEANVDIWLAASCLGMSAVTLERRYAHHRPDFQGIASRAFQAEVRTT
jgi:integrase